MWGTDTLYESLHISKINRRWARNTRHPSIAGSPVPNNLAKSSIVEKGEGVHPGT